ncbi:plasmid-partitioning protein SopA [Kistimonas scapharcae]|uniref:Plasmid-partitioning protein SopA n=1 Tax=Kistimonas scapharcae TaxID=1036133 RepID=A0ABP8V000_9GAMM
MSDFMLKYLEDIEAIHERGTNFLRNLEATMREDRANHVLDDSSDVVRNRVMNRRWRIQDVASLVGVNSTTIARKEKNGQLSPPDMYECNGSQRRLGYTLSQINDIRSHYNLIPSRGNGQPCVLSIQNFKGGSWKTTLTLLLGQWLALQGYRVLFIDSDPQGTLSFCMGQRPDYDTSYEDTIAPYLIMDSEYGYEDLKYAVKKTHWPNIDIIGSNLGNADIDIQFPQLLYAAQTPSEMEFLLNRFRQGIETVYDDYDVVLIDGTPSLSTTTICQFSAGDVCIMPVPAQMLDFASTLQFIQSTAQNVRSYIDNGIDIALPDIYTMITRFSERSYAEGITQVIKQTFGGYCLPNPLHKNDEIGKRDSLMCTIYEEVSKNINNRSSYNRALNMLEQAFTPILRDIIQPFWFSTAVDSQQDNELQVEGAGA